MSNIKILVTYKNENSLLKTDILTPIQTGRAIAEKCFENMIGDDTGDNISGRNAKFSEISAQYWAWKNYDKLGNPDYIGFMHYRRHFIFNNKNYDLDPLGCVHFPLINTNYLNDVGLNDKNIEKYIDGTDLIVANELDLNKLPWIEGEATPKKVLLAMGYIRKEDYDIFIRTIKNKAPEYLDIIEEFERGHTQHCYNMFIMKRELFKRYNEFLFPILFSLESEIDSSMYGVNGTRFLGYFSELLLTIFVQKIKKEKTYTKKFLKVSFIKKTSPEVLPLLFPDSDKNVISIVLSSFDYELELLATTLISIKKNSNDMINYNIIIIDKNISAINKLILNRLFEDNKNISLIFIELDELEQFYLKYIPTINKSIIEQYTCFFLPRIFSRAKQLIYLKVGVLVNEDISNLFPLDLKSNAIGACLDSIKITYYNSNFCNTRDFFDDHLMLVEPYKYFNGDVVVYNYDYWIKNNVDKELFSLVKKKKTIQTDEQAMNILLRNKIYYFDLAWNSQVESYHLKVQYPTLYGEIPSNLAHLSKHKKFIINYSSPFKPWFFTLENDAKLWWDYFRETPYYECGLLRLCQPNKGNANTNVSINSFFRLFFYKILYKITFGKIRKKLKSKYNYYKKIGTIK